MLWYFLCSFLTKARSKIHSRASATSGHGNQQPSWSSQVILQIPTNVCSQRELPFRCTPHTLERALWTQSPRNGVRVCLEPHPRSASPSGASLRTRFAPFRPCRACCLYGNQRIGGLGCNSLDCHRRDSCGERTGLEEWGRGITPKPRDEQICGYPLPTASRTHTYASRPPKPSNRWTGLHGLSWRTVFEACPFYFASCQFLATFDSTTNGTLRG